ncbi:MAG: hypothetical protein NTZ34_00130 [Chloroflexi bacterium]|nr:hypothetical protein [Chloroflexota bacterium]
MNNKPMVKKNPVLWWKIGLCALGVLLIAGAVIYALVGRNGTNKGTSANASATSAAAANNTQKTPGIGELNWAKDISKNYANSNFVFVILPGNADSTKTVDQTVTGAIEKMKLDGAVADVLTLSPQDPELQITADRLKITKLPAVLLLAAAGSSAIIDGNITETRLLQTYLTLQKTCAPGAGPGCCPK